MSQILDDLKRGFEKIDEFYSSKIRKPIVNFVNKVKGQKLAKISSDNSLNSDSEHAIGSTSRESEINTPAQVSSTEKYGISTDDNEIL